MPTCLNASFNYHMSVFAFLLKVYFSSFMWILLISFSFFLLSSWLKLLSRFLNASTSAHRVGMVFTFSNGIVFLSIIIIHQFHSFFPVLRLTLSKVLSRLHSFNNAHWLHIWTHFLTPPDRIAVTTAGIFYSYSNYKDKYRPTKERRCISDVVI